MLIQDPVALALYVKGQRKAKKLTQTEISEMVGTRQDTISNFENRPAKVHIDTLFRIIAATGLEIHIVPAGTPLGSESQWSEKW